MKDKLNHELKGEKPHSVNPPFNEPIKLSLSQIRCDGGTQSRAAIHQTTVDEYAEDYKNGANFPPITVFYDGEIFWLADGFHREKAALKAGLTEIAAIVKQGTRRDAVLYSVGANAKHGLRRTNADKRRAVMTLLEDEEWSHWSVSEISRQAKVSRPFVYKIMEENSHLSTFTSERTYTTKHGTVAKMNTANIGKSKADDSLPSSAEDKVSIPDSEQFYEDKEVLPPSFEENNHTDYAPVEIDNGKTDDKLKDSDFPKQSQKPNLGKPKLINPLSIGDKVKVKDNHYFGGIEGVVTQLNTPHTVTVAFENNERDVIKLTDLDLPPSLTKPITSVKSFPVKREILIKEGLNYKVGNPGYGCKWYLEVEEDDYLLFLQYQKKMNAPTIRSFLLKLIEEKKQQELPPKSDDILVNLSSQISYLNKQQKLFLASQLIESDPEILTQLWSQKNGH